jgi:hypothetical protein
MKLRGEWKRKIYGDEERYNINKVYVCCPADLVGEGQSTEKAHTEATEARREKGCSAGWPHSGVLNEISTSSARGSVKRSFESINSSFRRSL